MNIGQSFMPSLATVPDPEQYILGLEMGYDRERQMHEAAEYEATHDPLTGVLNLAGLAERLHLIDSTNTPVAMLFIDGDNIKAINDNLGHEAGDRAIVGTAITLESCLRNDDVIARIGGDEFVVLLTNEPRGEEEPMSLDQRVVNAKERLRKCVRKFQNSNHDLRDEGFDLSVGSAIRETGQSLIDTKHVAEAKMYEAKKNTNELTDEQRNAIGRIANFAVASGIDPRLAAQHLRSYKKPD